uniref:Uncharacterized protein n=1 Tax=Rhodococcus erythropolis TaxID=1833 RepID=Q6XMV3_RHOER|nr:hypothetical protein PBD2.193 [Rhodococcus erythropolis]
MFPAQRRSTCKAVDRIESQPSLLRLHSAYLRGQVIRLLRVGAPAYFNNNGAASASHARVCRQPRICLDDVRSVGSLDRSRVRCPCHEQFAVLGRSLATFDVDGAAARSFGAIQVVAPDRGMRLADLERVDLCDGSAVQRQAVGFAELR